MCDLPDGGMVYVERSLKSIDTFIESLGGRPSSDHRLDVHRLDLGWLVPLQTAYTHEQLSQIDALRPRGLYLPNTLNEFVADAGPHASVAVKGCPLQLDDRPGVAVLRVDADVHVVLPPDYDQTRREKFDVHLPFISFSLSFCPTYAEDTRAMFTSPRQSDAQEEEIVTLYSRIQDSIGMAFHSRN